jgi:translation initiation factor 3 subunit D
MSNLSDFLPPASDTWGPSRIDHTYTFVPVEFVGRTEKLGRFCDFTVSGMRARRPDQPEEFQFVDSRPLAGRARKYAPRAATQYQQAGRGKGKGAPYGRGRGQWGAVRIDHRTGKPVPVRPAGVGKPGQKPHWQRGPSNIVKGIREWSVPIKPEYTLLGEINLGAIGRKRGAGVSKTDWLITDASKIEYEDLIKCGQLAAYDKAFDKVSARKPLAVKKFDNINFYNVSTSQDPVMEELITRAAESEDMSENSLLIACTDQVLSVLMAANRSVYSWDLVITRNGNTILIDKRDSAACIDFQTVNENAQDPPSFDENLDPLQQINSPVKLGVEATAVSQNITQMLLSGENIEEMEYPNPFFDEEDDSSAPACTTYVYRKTFIPATATSIGRDLNFILRGEVNAKSVGNVAIKTLTEYDSKLTNWKDSFERNRETAVFATEMKNNSSKISRWLASCVVSDCDTLKVGFVARKNEEDPWNHQLLAVQTHSVSDLMAQMAMSQQSMWSSVLSLIEQIVGIEEETVGRYLIVKDPAKPVLNLYAIPWDEFEEPDHEDEEADDDDDEDDGEFHE